ncbi:hypothetical protein PF008_g30684 [Phytophthora fragariae]|uniref:Uncharacterized protein n=1 Tax=Phytophthora fragariae TaxID=53985 RepID=A0A6G0Q4T5_9STRA|nr:hypothetical protein PF008_g30684 [Phytophthora fragariae]
MTVSTVVFLTFATSLDSVGGSVGATAMMADGTGLPGTTGAGSPHDSPEGGS